METGTLSRDCLIFNRICVRVCVCVSVGHSNCKEMNILAMRDEELCIHEMATYTYKDIILSYFCARSRVYIAVYTLYSATLILHIWDMIRDVILK